MPEGHEAAQDYVRSVLGQDDVHWQDGEVLEEISPIQQDLGQEENAFLAQALEKMIAKEGDRMEREYMLEDDVNGVRYRGRFTLERIRDPELESQGNQGRSGSA
jgi:hypothetical protein